MNLTTLFILYMFSIMNMKVLWQFITGKCYSNSLHGGSSTVEPRFYDRRFNDIPDLTINILCPGKSNSKLYGTESRFNNVRFNDIPCRTMET